MKWMRPSRLTSNAATISSWASGLPSRSRWKSAPLTLSRSRRPWKSRAGTSSRVFPRPSPSTIPRSATRFQSAWLLSLMPSACARAYAPGTFRRHFRSWHRPHRRRRAAEKPRQAHTGGDRVARLDRRRPAGFRSARDWTDADGLQPASPGCYRIEAACGETDGFHTTRGEFLVAGDRSKAHALLRAGRRAFWSTPASLVSNHAKPERQVDQRLGRRYFWPSGARFPQRHCRHGAWLVRASRNVGRETSEPATQRRTG